MTGETEGKTAVAILRSNTRSNIEVAKLQTFDGTASKVSRFLMAYKLYIRMKMKEVLVEKQI